MMMEILLKLAKVNSRFLSLDPSLNLFVFVVNTLKLSLSG